MLTPLSSRAPDDDANASSVKKHMRAALGWQQGRVSKHIPMLAGDMGHMTFEGMLTQPALNGACWADLWFGARIGR